MAKKKEKVSFFEKVEFENSSVANDFLAKENRNIKFKFICAVLAGVGTLVMSLGMNQTTTHIFDSDLMGTIGVIIFVAGIIATLLSGPLNIVKLIWKLGKFCYWVVPFLLVDLAAFVFGLCMGLVVFMYFPVVFAVYNLYQSYRNKVEAEKYIALYSGLTGSYGSTKESNVYECPNCKSQLMYGETRCKNCGASINW